MLKASIIFGVGLFAGVVVGWFLPRNTTEITQRVIAASWGDGKYGPSFYGAQVVLEPVNTGYSVKGRVWIGPGNPYLHDCGELGRVANYQEAVEKWSKITWKEEGLYIGTGGPDDYFLARKKMESHR
jgi:hypothetical protein